MLEDFQKYTPNTLLHLHVDINGSKRIKDSLRNKILYQNCIELPYLTF